MVKWISAIEFVETYKTIGKGFGGKMKMMNILVCWQIPDYTGFKYYLVQTIFLSVVLLLFGINFPFSGCQIMRASERINKFESVSKKRVNKIVVNLIKTSFMKLSYELKKEPDKNTGNADEKNQPAKAKKEPDENKTEQQISALKAEKELKKSIERWDTDGGKNLCP